MFGCLFRQEPRRLFSLNLQIICLVASASTVTWESNSLLIHCDSIKFNTSARKKLLYVFRYLHRTTSAWQWRWIPVGNRRRTQQLELHILQVFPWEMFSLTSATFAKRSHLARSAKSQVVAMDIRICVYFTSLKYTWHVLYFRVFSGFGEASGFKNLLNWVRCWQSVAVFLGVPLHQHTAPHHRSVAVSGAEGCLIPH